MNHRNAALILKSYRVRRDLSRSKVAKSLKITPQFYGRIEKGEIGLPPTYFKKIIRLLDIHESHFVDALINDERSRINNYL